MCIGMGGGSQQQQPAQQQSPQEVAAIESQKAYRKERVNRLNAYSPIQTDLIGSVIESSNDNATEPTTALKKLMGA